MARKTKTYVDTSAFIAFLDRSDSYHPLFSRLFSDPPKLITTPLVIAEGHAWFLRRYDLNRAFQFMGFVEDLRPLSISSIGTSEVTKGHQIMREFSDQELTLADALGLVLMKAERIHQCWSTDRHLGLTGIPLIIHEV